MRLLRRPPIVSDQLLQAALTSNLQK